MSPLASLSWNLPGVRIAFSTAADGDQRDAGHRARWLATLGVGDLEAPRQVHGARVADVDRGDDLSGADAVVTSDPRLALGVFGADCPGLCLAAPDRLGMAHCGWRGTAAGIVAALARAIGEVSRHPPATWRAFVGPGIGGEAYEVDAPVLTARHWPAATLLPSPTQGRARLDLPRAIAADLLAVGVTEVSFSGRCTASDPRLWSYRRRGAGLVQLLAAWRGIAEGNS